MKALFVILLASFNAFGDGRSLRRSSVATLKVRNDYEDLPFCQFGGRPGFNGSVAVYLTKDNTRSFSFGVEDAGTQTEVACNGPIPLACSTRSATKLEEVPPCDDFACDCVSDSSTLQFVYMKKMMKEAIPMCELQQSGFHALMIGLGGGALPQYLLSHCPSGTSVESVEYDPRVIDVATHFFGLHVAAGVNEVENNDGGKAVQARVENGKKYDLVMVDCFQSEGFVPDSCRDERFVSGLHAILKNGGAVIQQVWGRQYQSTLGTYEKVFGKQNTLGIDAELEVSWLIKATVPSTSE
mmetsp:Transcript_30287/g.48906  ORF Transcript_30287/g.48906 Transcript_30287/m.48906 type:complete len:297 (-) Transcript_30287:98-988(-)